MFVKADIRKVVIALEKMHAQAVYLALGRAGMIHLACLEGGGPGMDAELKEEEVLTREVLEGAVWSLHALGLEPVPAGTPGPGRDIRRDASYIARVKKTIERAQRLMMRVQEKADISARRIASHEALERMGIDPRVFSRARLVHTVFGTVENTGWEMPSDAGYLLATADHYVCGIALPADSESLLQFLRPYGFVDRSGDIGDTSREALERSAESCRHRLAVLDGYRERLRRSEGAMLRELLGVYQGYAEIVKAMRLSFSSARAMVITGWMDVRDKPRLISLLGAQCGDRFILTVHRDPCAPVRLRNIRIFKPFELLVRTMGMPANREVDPTPLTAVTYVLMFGLMFGDLGQGLVLTLGGYLLKRSARKTGREGLEKGGGILIACGLSAAVCGLLYGSFFSSERLIPALWFHPATHIMQLFSATILMGIVFIAVGLVVNIINSLINADYVEGLLEKRGLAVLVLYAAVVLLSLRYIRTGQAPAAWETGVFIALPLAIFALRGVLGPVLFQGPKPHHAAEYVIETFMEIMEIGLSLFANTISFIRVGAFALSHGGLSIVTYTLAAMADPALHSPGAVSVIVIGNIFIIGFEGLVCGIQSLRLEYYEFFGKFFGGDGVAFTPFQLTVKTSEV